jgi:hypothetical protein
MRVFVLAPVGLSLVAGAVVLVATVALQPTRAPTLCPVVLVPVPTVNRHVEDVPEPDIDAATTLEYLDDYDRAALSIMNNGEQLGDRELELRFMTEIGADVDGTVYRLREHERVIRWDSPPPHIHGGGARASVFAYDGNAWRQVGHVDSSSWTSSVYDVEIDVEQGIAIMVEALDGNGAPPSRAVAFAVDGDKLISTSVEDVPNIAVDSTGPEPIVRLWRRVDELNRYPDSPIRVSQWKVRRARHGLVATETPNTPWIDALAAFCADPSRSDAAPQIRARVARCEGDARVRWAEGKRLVVALGLVLRCGEDQQHHGEAELRLASIHGHWRVVEASSCLPLPDPTAGIAPSSSSGT